MNFIDDDEPSIALKIKFDQMNPELLKIIYLLSLLVTFTLVYLILLIVDFIVKKSRSIYGYYKRLNSTSPQMLFD
jgi:hypothetical protein